MKNQWRTFSGLLALGVMMVASLALCRGQANGPQLLSPVVTGLGGLGLWLAGKASAEHIANAKVRNTAPPADRLAEKSLP